MHHQHLRTGMTNKFTLKINGKTHNVEVEPDTPLLYVLRNDIELNGAKFGCGLGQCGACTVIVGGESVRSCQLPVAMVRGADILTIEGLGTVAKPHPLQRAFIDEQAAQCGYCINGMIMTARALLARKPDPSMTDIREALAGNLCRCGTHHRILRAIARAAEVMGGRGTAL
jgi:nicotinate dehydrogenase subunit A